VDLVGEEEATTILVTAYDAGINTANPRESQPK